MKKIFFIPFLVFNINLHCQVSGLMASYHFNNGNANDDIGAYNGTVVGATLTNDRFGNANHAYYFLGTPNSYIRLTTSSVIKKNVESISLWTKPDTISSAGSGFVYNPILLTKCQAGNSLFEAYCLYYDPSNGSFITIETQPPANEKYFFSNPVNFHSWYHVVLAYDNDSIWLFVNSVLQQTMYKGFSSVFLAGDSVMLGNSANVLNDRFFHGAIDDIGFYDHVLSQQEVNVLYGDPNPIANITQYNDSFMFSVYPNPTQNNLFVSGKNIFSYNITNVLGQKIKGDIFNSMDNTIEISELQNGVYYLEIIDKDGNRAIRKIAKE